MIDEACGDDLDDCLRVYIIVAAVIEGRGAQLVVVDGQLGGGVAVVGVPRRPLLGAQPLFWNGVTQKEPHAARLKRRLKGGAEIAVEVSVNERVERRVEVADPEDHGHHHRRAVTALSTTQGRDHIPEIQRGIHCNRQLLMIT